MAARKLAIIGTGSNATIKVTVNGTEAYTGPITGVAPGSGILAIVPFDNDNSVITVKSVSVEVLTGEIDIGDCQYNLVNIINPALTPTEEAFVNVPTNQVPADIAASVAAKGGFIVNGENYFGAGSTAGSDSRSNIFIDGVEQTPENNVDSTGVFVPIAGWGWDILAGSTISFNVTVPAQETLPA